jgi:zinc-binding alcohol dehydrogenase/oxidoreductase
VAEEPCDGERRIAGREVDVQRSLATRGLRATLSGMRALRLTAVNEMGVVEVSDPEPAPGEVLVGLRAAALNHRDVWIKQGQYAGLKWPVIPGSDGAGTVLVCGPDVDPAWRGRDVIVNPSFDWGNSEQAQGGQFTILGLPRDGTLAGKIVVPAVQLSPKPAHLTWEEAAALPLAGLTAYRALFSRAGLQAGERVLISGIGGGVALFAMQFALAARSEVWVTSSSDEKIARAVQLGAKGGFNYTRGDWAAGAAKSPGLFDVIVDSAGGEGFEQLMDLGAPGGRIVFFGATRGNPPVLPMRKIFWRQLSLLGTTMGSPRDWDALLTFVAHHHVRPVVSEAFPLERAADAVALMERGGQFGKIVVRM